MQNRFCKVRGWKTSLAQCETTEVHQDKLDKSLSECLKYSLKFDGYIDAVRKTGSTHVDSIVIACC